MLADGHGHQLYDVAIQQQYQARYAGRVGTLYTHPPFEALIYLLVAWLPLRRAYLLWSLLSLGFLTVGMRHLAKTAQFPWDWRILFGASLTFVPALLCLLQGQDSLLLLMLVILAFTALRANRAFSAGCWLGLGLFKFQLTLPLMLVLVLSQGRSTRNGIMKGFSLIALALAAVSVAVSGWSVLTLYPRFLVHFPELPSPDIFPLAMANLRGLTYFFFRQNRLPWAVAVVSILSAAGLIKTLVDWKDAQSAAGIALDASTALSQTRSCSQCWSVTTSILRISACF